MKSLYVVAILMASMMFVSCKKEAVGTKDNPTVAIAGTIDIQSNPGARCAIPTSTQSTGLTYYWTYGQGQGNTLHLGITTSSNGTGRIINIYLRQHGQGVNIYKILNVSVPAVIGWYITQDIVFSPVFNLPSPPYDVVIQGHDDCRTITNTYSNITQ